MKRLPFGKTKSPRQHHEQAVTPHPILLPPARNGLDLYLSLPQSFAKTTEQGLVGIIEGARGIIFMAPRMERKRPEGTP